ncbi:MAG: 4a-hydroxytetrahydrobiopterin dehydratase [Simkaniaceae bacterium]|nr:4a-hydroxytetrahydrobiopterin dehydratase [Simkaniaceae bacterium]
MNEKNSKKCVPCLAGQPPLKGAELQEQLPILGKDWEIIDEHHLKRTYKFKNFRDALEFTNIIGKIAEEEGHHPEISLSFGSVTLLVWTHKIDGLSKNDFILAEKCDAAFISLAANS